MSGARGAAGFPSPRLLARRLPRGGTRPIDPPESASRKRLTRGRKSTELLAACLTTADIPVRDSVAADRPPARVASSRPSNTVTLADLDRSLDGTEDENRRASRLRRRSSPPRPLEAKGPRSTRTRARRHESRHRGEGRRGGPEPLPALILRERHGRHEAGQRLAAAEGPAPDDAPPCGGGGSSPRLVVGDLSADRPSRRHRAPVKPSNCLLSVAGSFLAGSVWPISGGAEAEQAPHA